MSLLMMMCVGDMSARESVANSGGQYSELAVFALRWAMAFRITGFGKTILDLYKIDDLNM